MLYHLKNLSCSSCAFKIEQELKKDKEIDFVKIDLANKVLRIDSKKNKYNSIVEVVKKFEPTVEVERFEKKSYLEEILIILGIVLFAAGFFIESYKFYYLLAVYIFVSYDVLIKAFKGILSLKIFDENFLMSVASIGAFIISEHLEAIAVMLFFKVGEYFEHRAVDNSRNKISLLNDFKVDKAIRVEGFNNIEIDPLDIKIGDILLVLQGEKIPVDSVLVEGETFLDQSSLTGESDLLNVREGSNLISGALNTSNPIKVRALKEYSDSTVAKIIDLIEKSKDEKTFSERFITKFSYYYTPIVVLLSLIISLGGYLLTTDTKWVYRGLLFLVVSCPCALVISVPLAYFSAIGISAKNSILVKGSNYFEMLLQVGSVFFDKTGTITTGNFEIVNVEGEETLYYAKSVEMFSTHPIAKSINKTESAYSKDVEIIEDIRSFGIIAKVDDKKVVVGKKELLENNNIEVSVNVANKAVYVSVDSILIGYIELKDKLKEGTTEVIDYIKNNITKDIKVLTGDNKENSSMVSKELGIDIIDSLLPHQKVKIVEQQEKTKRVMYVGDGINDAPVIARSSIGVSFSDVASYSVIDASDILILSNSFKNIISMFKISKKTKSIVLQNIIVALAVKVLVMILSVFGIANMWLAIFSDIGVTILAIFNSMRLLFDKKLIEK